MVVCCPIIAVWSAVRAIVDKVKRRKQQKEEAEASPGETEAINNTEDTSTERKGQRNRE